MTLVRTYSYQSPADAGILYLVSTPIGNLGDMSRRAIEILSQVKVIAAEDTRHTRKLLTHFSIEGPQVVSYHEHNKSTAADTLLQVLGEGFSVACVTDAGTPGISDPGADLVAAVRERGWPVTCIPGPTAAIGALTISGLPTDQFSFAGFLPRSKKDRREALEKWVKREETLIFYEAPHRIKETIKEMSAVFGPDRKMAAVRELTKRYEEVINGTVEEINQVLQTEEIRGEWVLVVAGADSAELEAESLEQEHQFLSVHERVEQIMQTGMTKKEAIKQVAKERNVSRNEVYQEVLDL